jgi:hypothetical protein
MIVDFLRAGGDPNFSIRLAHKWIRDQSLGLALLEQLEIDAAKESEDTGIVVRFVVQSLRSYVNSLEQRNGDLFRLLGRSPRLS